MNPVELSQPEKQHLSELAEKTRDDGVRAAVGAYLECVDETAEPNSVPPTQQARPIWEEIDDISRDTLKGLHPLTDEDIRIVASLGRVAFRIVEGLGGCKRNGLFRLPGWRVQFTPFRMCRANVESGHAKTGNHAQGTGGSMKSPRLVGTTKSRLHHR